MEPHTARAAALVALAVAALAAARRGRATHNDGTLAASSPAAAAQAAAGLRRLSLALGRVNALLAEEGVQIVTVLNTSSASVAGATRHTVDAMVFDRRTLAQTAQRIVAAEAADGGVTLAERFAIAPVPQQRVPVGEQVRTFLPLRAAAAQDDPTHYRFERPTSIGHSSWRPTARIAKAFDWSVIGQVRPPPLEELSHALAYERSAAAFL